MNKIIIVKLNLKKLKNSLKSVKLISLNSNFNLRMQELNQINKLFNLNKEDNNKKVNNKEVNNKEINNKEVNNKEINNKEMMLNAINNLLKPPTMLTITCLIFSTM
jgi:hypothetical protein